jgi:hypothetical protein
MSTIGMNRESANSQSFGGSDVDQGELISCLRDVDIVPILMYCVL